MLKLLWNCFKKFVEVKLNRIKEIHSLRIQRMQSYVTKLDLSNLKYEDLAPKDDIEKSNSYISALDWAFTNDKVFNIALTGTYGAGKSSILRTYEKKRPHNYYLNISLASFYEERDVNFNLINSKEIDGSDTIEAKGASDFEDTEIEKSILQQLFYKVSSSKIPYSRFRKIKNIKILKLTVILGIVFFNFILGLILFRPSIISDLQNNIIELKNFYNSNILISVGYFVFFILSTFLIINFIKYSNMRLKLSKITIEKAELELDKASDESIFNKYLDEILYFFEVTRYNIVFIEDLDRFNNTRIFIKLRELNSLINNCEQINRKIVFIYAVKDDMLKRGNRTKFFDFIIPVIPVINYSNSGEKFLEKIRQSEIGQDITEEFINGVSVYIDDMRILNNIYNEFIVYKDILTDVSLKAQQILSLIIYKNLYPSDFAKLQFNQGLIFQAFNGKGAFIRNRILDIRKKRSELEEKLKRANQDFLSSIKELKMAFLYNLVGRYEKINDIRVNYQKRYTCEQVLDDNFELSLLDHNNITVIFHNGHSAQSSMSEADQRSGSDFTYLQRLDYIKVKDKSKQEQLTQEIQALKKEENTLNSATLKELIDEFGAMNLLSTEILQEKPIVYILRNGYIDETYANYLTYFYPNSLSVNDMNFILGVRNREAFEFSYKLMKLERLISKLNLYEFEQKEILNFTLLEFLIENKEKYQKQISLVIKQLCNETPISITFIDEFKDFTKYKSVFWREICHKWHNIWSFLDNFSSFSDPKKDIYLKNIISYADISDIEYINHDKRLSTYISRKSEFLQLVSSIDLNKSIQVISNLDIKFEDIISEGVNKELLEYVFENHLYIINIQMIRNIIQVKSPENEHFLTNSNLSVIKKVGYDPLLNYINKNIDKYLKNVFMKLETNNNEEIDTIVEIINRSDISDDMKNNIIDKQNFILPDISSAPELLWNKIISSVKVKISWDNVFKYYEKSSEINDVLVRFLNYEKVFTNLSKTKFKVGNEISDKVIFEFSEQLIKSAISETAFCYLVKSITYLYDNFEISKLSCERVDVLIDEDILNFTVENYNNLKQHFHGKHTYFIGRYTQKYLTEQDKYIVDAGDLQEILESSWFTTDEKIKIILNLDIDILDNYLLKLICEIILGSVENHQLPYELFNKIWGGIPDKNKLKLLINQIRVLTIDNITNCLNDLGGAYALITMPKRKVKIEYTNEVLALAKELKECGYISTFTEINQEIDIGVNKKLVQFNTKVKLNDNKEVLINN